MVKRIFILALSALAVAMVLRLVLAFWNPWVTLDTNVLRSRESRGNVPLIAATNDTFHAALLLSDKFLPREDDDMAATERLLDRIVRRVSSRLSAGDSELKAVSVMSDCLFRDLKFTASSNDSDETILLPGPVLRNRRGHCVSLSLLYLAVAEKLRVPLHPRYVPGHVWVALEHGRATLNVETTARGAILPDRYYRSLIYPATAQKRYPRTLTKKQFLGLFLHDVAFCLDQKGLTKPALAAYLEAKSLFPDDPVVDINLASLYRFLGKYREAGEVLEHAVRIQPFMWQIHSNLGPLWFDLEDYPKAISAFRRTTRLLHQMLTINDYVEHPGGVKDLQAKLIANPNDLQALNILGILRFREGKVNEAGDLFERVLRQDPTNAKMCANLAIVNYQLGRFDEVRRYCRMERQYAGHASTGDVAALYGTLVDSFIGLGKSYAANGQCEDAIRIFTYVVRLDPSNTEALNALADLQAQREKGRPSR